MIHSDTNNLVGIVPHAGSTKSAPMFEAKTPTRPLNAIWYDYTIKQIMTCVALLFAFFLFGYLIHRYCY